MRTRRLCQDLGNRIVSPPSLRPAWAAATLAGALLLPGPAAAEFEPAAAQARVEAALGEPFSAASVDQVAEAVAGIVAGLPPAELQRSIDLVGGVAALMPDRASATRVAEAARGAAREVAEAHPEVIEDWWADIIVDSIAMAADEAFAQAEPAPAAHAASADAKPVGFSFGEAQSKVAARLGEPIADAAPDELGRAVAAEIAALPPDQIQHSITIAGAVAAKLTNPAAMRAVADSAAAAVERVAMDNPGAVPGWRKDGIVESIGLFVGLDTGGIAPAAAPPEALPKPTYSVADGDLTIVPEPAEPRALASPGPEPEQERAEAPAEVRAAEVTPEAKPDTVPAAAEPPADGTPTRTAMRPPRSPADRMDGGLPRPEEVRAVLRDQGLPATAQNLNRAMATLLSDRDVMSPAPAGASCDGLDLSGLRAAAGAGRCAAEYAEALALIQPAAGADATRRRTGLRDRDDWWRDPGSNDSRDVAGNDASDGPDRNSPGGGGGGGGAEGTDDVGNGGADDGGGGRGGDSGESDGGSEDDSGSSGSGNGGGGGDNGSSDNGNGNGGGGDNGNSDDGNNGNGNGNNGNGNSNSGNGNGNRGGDDDRGRGNDDDDDRGRGGGRGDRDDDRGGLGSAADAIGDAVGGLLD